MKILACIKPVPDTDAPGVNPDRIDFDMDTPLRMNRFDEYAMETAVRIKEAFTNASIDVVSLGPESAKQVIKRAAGMGADCGIHIACDGPPPPDPYLIAAAIAQAAREKHYQLIIAGVMSEDLMNFQVGPMIAGLLKLPCATAVVHQQINADQTKLYVERELEGGDREMLNIYLPAVITVQSGIYTPRYPSLSKMLKANQMPIEHIPAAAVMPQEATQCISDIRPPEKSRAGRALEGSAEEKADQLIEILKGKGLL